MFPQLLLQCLATDLWAVAVHRYQGGLHVRLRMTVIRLPNGSLWLYSPVPIDDELANDLAALGPVEHIIAPNCFHHLHAAAAKRRYPQAKLWAAPGLREKCPDVPFDAVVSEPELPWEDVLETLLIAGYLRSRWCVRIFCST